MVLIISSRRAPAVAGGGGLVVEQTGLILQTDPSGVNAETSSVTPNASGNLLLFFIVGRDDSTEAGVPVFTNAKMGPALRTYGTSTACTEENNQKLTNARNAETVFSVVTTGTGAVTFQFTWDTTPRNHLVYFVEISGQHATPIVSTAWAATNSGTSVSSGMTTSYDGSIVVGVGLHDDRLLGAGLTAGAGFIRRDTTLGTTEYHDGLCIFGIQEDVDSEADSMSFDSSGANDQLSGLWVEVRAA